MTATPSGSKRTQQPQLRSECHNDDGLPTAAAAMVAKRRRLSAPANEREPASLADAGDDATNKNKSRNDSIHNNDNINNDNDKNSDEWTEEQHREFVASIFDIGLKNASPAVILENMTQKVESITSERVKSKLQKYRSEKNREKSREEFMDEYCQFLEHVGSLQLSETSGGTGTRTRTATTRIVSSMDHPHHHHGHHFRGRRVSLLSQLLGPASGRDGGPKHALLGGEVAGYLTHTVRNETAPKTNTGGQRSSSSSSLLLLSPNGANGYGSASAGAAGGGGGGGGDGDSHGAILSTNVLRSGAQEYVENYAGSAIQFPILTETEKKSSLGIAMTFIAGLFLTMSQHLKRERARAETIGLKLTTTSTSTSTSTLTSTSTSSSTSTSNAAATAAAAATDNETNESSRTNGSRAVR